MLLEVSQLLEEILVMIKQLVHSIKVLPLTQTVHGVGGAHPSITYFSAARSNSLYGASETVTPVSLAVQYLIKY